MRGVSASYQRATKFLHIVSTGQSLGIGELMTAVTKTPFAYNQSLFDSSGAYSNPNASTLFMVPLVAPTRGAHNPPGSQVYPINVDGENVDVSMAKEIARRMTVPIFTTAVGQGGAAMSQINKGGSTISYASALFEAQAIKRLRGTNGFCPCVVITHGETDAAIFTTNYQSLLTTLQANFQTDLTAIWGGTTIPLLSSQQNAVPNSGLGTNLTALAQLAAMVANPALCPLMGPKYQYRYPATGFGVHTNLDYPTLGEKLAQCILTMLNGKQWLPLYPTAFSRSGQVVTITFNVPAPPLVFDTVHTAPHGVGTQFAIWAAGNGLEAYDTPLTLSTISGNGVSPIQYTFTGPHGMSTNDYLFVGGVAGNTNANGCFQITVNGSNTVTANGTTGNGNYGGIGPGGIVVSPIPITSAVIVGNQIVMTLGRAPRSGLKIAAAHNCDLGYNKATGGFADQNQFGVSGRCTVIRDSDPWTGLTGLPNYNWLVEFEQAVA